MRFHTNLLFITLFCVLQLGGQAQQKFDYQNKKGGLYFFSTFYDSDRVTPLEGKIWEGDSIEPNAIRTFKKGILQEEIRFGQDRIILGNYKAHKGRDSIISTYQARDELNRISESWIFYYNKEKRRIMDITLYHTNGKKRMHYAYAGLKREDLEYSQQAPLPDHVIDVFGYGFDQAPYGHEEEWDDQGQLIRQCQYIFKPYRSFDKNQELHGPFVLYHNNGGIKEKGIYHEGQKNGLWTKFHFNGKIEETGEYEYGFPIKTWKGYHDDGSPSFIRQYPNFVDVRSIHNETQWNRNGNKTVEIQLDSSGNGTKTIWNENQTIIEFSTITQWNMNLFGKKYSYFSSGKLQRYQDFHPRADTTLMEYWGNGQLMKLHLRENNTSTQKEFNESGICTLFRQFNAQQKKGITEIKNQLGELISKEITSGDTSQFFISKNGITKTYQKANDWLEGRFVLTQNGTTQAFQYHKGIRITNDANMQGNVERNLSNFIEKTRNPKLIETLFTQLDSIHHDVEPKWELVNLQLQALEKELLTNVGETFSREENHNLLRPQQGYRCDWDCGANFTLFSIRNYNKPVAYIVFYNNGSYEFFNDSNDWEKWNASENFYKDLMWND